VPATNVYPQHRPPAQAVHQGACGERIPSPHERCQRWAGPNYNAAEVIQRRATSMGPVRVVIYVCNVCNATWQESRATA
jgi:hypothetical protein